MMEAQRHSLENLFEQLGIATTDNGIGAFIDKNTPIPSTIALHQASFWTPSQAAFLLQSKVDDADWSELVDQLDVMLR